MAPLDRFPPAVHQAHLDRSHCTNAPALDAPKLCPSTGQPILDGRRSEDSRYGAPRRRWVPRVPPPMSSTASYANRTSFNSRLSAPSFPV